MPIDVVRLTRRPGTHTRRPRDDMRVLFDKPARSASWAVVMLLGAMFLPGRAAATEPPGESTSTPQTNEPAPAPGGPTSPVTPFRSRPLVVAAELGYATGVGLRVGYAPIPELDLSLHGRTTDLRTFLGADVSYRPLAGGSSVTPVLRLGLNAMRDNFAAILGVPPWMPVGEVALGVEWRSEAGLTLGAGVGALASLSPDRTGFVLPSAEFRLGYAFSLAP